MKSLKMKHGSLFSGIGGFDLAAEWMGWENVFHCDNNKFCQKILKYYWPNATSYGDIKETDFSEWKGRVDIVSGGFPCQPYSLAGKRKGKEDDRHLWPEMLRAIREIQPVYVVGENVYGLLNWSRGLVFDEVQADLENEGYEVTPYILPACAKNAPHRRDRIWFVAHSSKVNGKQVAENGKWNCGKQIGEGGAVRYQFASIGEGGIITHSQQLRQPGSGWTKGQGNTEANGNWKASWSDSNGGWPTVSPIRGGNDGLSSKLVKQCLEGLGNAIVPQVAYEIFKAIEKVIETHP